MSTEWIYALCGFFLGALVMYALLRPRRDDTSAIAALESAKSLGELRNEIENLKLAQQSQTMETVKLLEALRAPSVRGQWGEVQLRRVMELAGMLEHVDFEQQVTLAGEQGQVRPDALVHMANGRKVLIDAKAPMKAYLDAAALTDPKQRQAQYREHSRQLKRHIDQLSLKAYPAHLKDGPEFAVIFLPLEPMLGAALEQDPSLLDYSVERKVLLASPMTLLALLKALSHGWSHRQLSENAEAIRQTAITLHDRLATFHDHLRELGKSLAKASEAYNRTLGSLEARVTPSLRKMEELGAGSRTPIPPPEEITVRPRNSD